MMPNGWKMKTVTEAGIVVTDGDRGKEYPNSSEFLDDGYCLFLSAKNVTKKDLYLKILSLYLKRNISC